jgi:hypothetical protein
MERLCVTILSIACSFTFGHSFANEKSLYIPTIEELRNPTSSSSYGPNSGLVNLKSHSVSSEGYLILTDYTDQEVLFALNELAKARAGTVIRLKCLGTLHENPRGMKLVKQEIRKANPRFIAVAPKVESFRENMHLCMLKLISNLDSDVQLDAFFGYLIASTPKKLIQLVHRSIQFQPLTQQQVNPVSIGAIEDTDGRRYRSYQKAKIMQKMFAHSGKDSTAIIVTTRKSHTLRDDYPKLSPDEGNIVMSPKSKQQTFQSLSLQAQLAIERSNLLFMYGHGTTNRICGIKISAFSETNFFNKIIFCGSCMSAAPYKSDRVNLNLMADHKRFAFHAMDNGAIIMLGHMGLSGGFPKVFPMAEKILNGTTAGEAYQQLMNSIIEKSPIPNFYGGTAQRRDPGNKFLYVLLGDPFLLPITK